MLYHHHYHPLLLLDSSLADSQNSTGLTDQTLLIYYSDKNFLTVQRVLSIAAFCIRMYRQGRRLSSFKLLCSFTNYHTTNKCTNYM